MIIYIIFGKSEGDLVVILENSELINKMALKENLDPKILFGMAKALYSMGTELKGGKLKALDLKNYSILTNANQDQLLALVLDNSKRNNSKIKVLNDKMNEIFNLFLKCDDTNIKSQATLENLKNSMQKIIPSMKKSVRKLYFK
ncbi:MAG: hypothetical protein ACTSPA_01050 [Promethearchaeota archaeon]